MDGTRQKGEKENVEKARGGGCNETNKMNLKCSKVIVSTKNEQRERGSASSTEGPIDKVKSVDFTVTKNGEAFL